MHTYRCEWRIDVSAETPEEAAKKAEELMRGAWLSCWTVIDEDGNEQNFDVPALYDADDTCGYCAHSDDPCGAQHPDRPLLCTRESGHEGDHVACGESHSFAQWSERPKGAA